MPFTTPPPQKPTPPPIGTVWIDLRTGRLTQAAQDYIIKLDEYHKALTAHLAAMAASIP